MFAPVAEASTVLGAYNHSAEAALLALDKAAGLRPFVAVMPEAANVSIAPTGTYEARVSVPVGALLWGISGKSAQTAGATVQVTDSKTQKPLFSQPINIGNVTGGTITVPDCYGTNHNYTGPVHMLPKAMIVVSPGILQVKIVNLAAAANSLQVALHFAIPNPAGIAHPNEYNAAIAHELDLANRALRDPGTGSLVTNTGAGGTLLPTGNLVDTLISVPFDISTAGDNVVVAGNSAGRISIYQLDLWNVAAVQDISLKNGATLLRGALANFPPQQAYDLPFQSSYHFQLSPGQPFIINLSVGTQVTGFVRYRLE